MGLFKKEERGELVIVLDIRSSSIGGSFVEFHPKKTPHVLYTKRIPTYFKDNKDSGKFIELMYRTLKDVLHSLQDYKIKEINQSFKTNIPVYIAYSSPWFMAETKNIHMQKPKPFIFTKDTLKKIISKEVLFKTEDTIERIEGDITHVIVNGYELKNPYNKKITEIDISLYVSAISKPTYKETSSIIKSYFNTKNIIHRTNTLITFTTLRNIFPHTKNFVYIDVGGEVTDIGIVEQNKLVHAITIPIGYHLFIRELSNKLNLEESQSRSLIESFNKNGQMEHKEAYTILSKTASVWIDEIKKTLATTTHLLPRNMFISSEEQTGNFFSDIIKGTLFDHDGDAETPPINVTVMSHEHLNHLLTYAKDVSHDTFIELQATFLDSLIKSD